MNCRHVANDQPRMLRTHIKDCITSGCGGCQPCEERHCSMPDCTGRHLGPTENQACARCVGTVRTDIGMIVAHCQSETIVEELLERGPRSNAAWILAPTADADTWHRRESLTWVAAIDGDKGAKGWLEDNRHEFHPMWVLGCWDLLLRRYYDLDTTERVTVAKAATFILEHLTNIARDPGFDFSVLANQMHQTRTMLEHVLPIDHGPQRGAPCPHCEVDLVKVYDVDDTSGASDRWHCKPCNKWWTEGEYQLRVGTEYLGNAPTLTASQIKHQYAIPEGTVRRWAAPTLDKNYNEVPAVVRKRGKNDQGLQLYDVGDVKTQIARREGVTEEAS